MNPIGPALAALSAEIARRSAALGERVSVSEMGVTDRRGVLDLQRPGRFSANRACGLVRGADGWLALNLARDEDRALVPAWLRTEPAEDVWAQIRRLTRRRTVADLIEGAIMLGLPAGRVGETAADTLAPPLLPYGAPRRSRPDRLRVIDLSALWAGPLCGAVLAAMGAAVTKVESPSRPDPTRTTAPEFFRRLNGRKAEATFEFRVANGRAELRRAFEGADLVITSARPRAFAGLGLAPETVFAANPSLVWVAITGYGWTGPAAERVAFGDDAAAAGGLVRWTPGGAPRFQGDALSDPVTGLAAAVGALTALEAGGGVLVDAAMARAAGGAAALARRDPA